METRIAGFGLALALPLLLSLPGPSSAQTPQPGTRWADQDTTEAGQVGPRLGGRCPGCGAWALGGQGRGGFGRGARFGQGHVGPRMLIGLRDELALSDEQVSKLEKIHEDHRSLMQAQMEQRQELRERQVAARRENDWDALEKGIDEWTKLEAGIARGLLNVERQTLGVLSDEQRGKFESWREGVRVFRRQRIERRREVRGEGMRGRGMRRQNRAAPPPPSLQF